MKRIMFVKPLLEVDAVWDAIRTCSYLGIWFLASYLKERGYEVRYLDEVVRNNGLEKIQLFLKILTENTVVEKFLDISNVEFQRQKMMDFQQLSPQEFVKKYSAFKNAGRIERIMARVGNPLEQTLAEVEKYNPDVVGIPLIATANYLPATRMAREIKKRLPRVKIIFGGQHITAMTEQFVRDNPYIDHVVTGDAINVIEGIVNETITDKIVHGGFQTMDNFPLLDPAIIEENDYPLEPTYAYTTNGRKSADFMFSKGCFRNCEFCMAGSQQENRVSVSDYERLDDQLRLFKNYGIKELVIQDDAFLWNREHRQKHLPKILGLMKKHGMYWQNNGGVEFEGIDGFVTDQFISYNKIGEGRITALYIPFNPRSWNKKKSAAKSMSSRYHENLENLKRLREKGGIYIFTSAMIGTPEQTRQTFEEELATDKELVQKGYIDAALPLCATMLPGTNWHRDNGHNIVNKEDYPGYSLFTTHHRTPFLEPQEIEEMMVKCPKSLGDVQKTHLWGSAFPSYR